MSVFINSTFGFSSPTDQALATNSTGIYNLLSTATSSVSTSADEVGSGSPWTDVVISEPSSVIPSVGSDQASSTEIESLNVPVANTTSTLIFVSFSSTAAEDYNFEVDPGEEHRVHVE